MEKIKRTEIPLELEQTLIRKRDNLKKQGIIRFVEWDKNNKFVKIYEYPKVGYSIVVDPYKFSHTWLTTAITKIISETEFETENSKYKIV